MIEGAGQSAARVRHLCHYRHETRVPKPEKEKASDCPETSPVDFTSQNWPCRGRSQGPPLCSLQFRAQISQSRDLTTLCFVNRVVDVWQ